MQVGVFYFPVAAPLRRVTEEVRWPSDASGAGGLMRGAVQ